MEDPIRWLDSLSNEDRDTIEENEGSKGLVERFSNEIKKSSK